MKKPILDEQFADNGEHSHWHLIDSEEGMVLWSSFPEETIAKGQKIHTPYGVLENQIEEIERLKAENSKLKMTIKRLQPRRLVDED